MAFDARKFAIETTVCLTQFQTFGTRLKIQRFDKEQVSTKLSISLSLSARKGQNFIIVAILVCFSNI